MLCWVPSALEWLRAFVESSASSGEGGVFGGDLSLEWVENLNSALDDNGNSSTPQWRETRPSPNVQCK